MIEVYDPGGTQRTQAQRMPQVSADDFGGAQARALTQVGGALQQVGSQMSVLEEREKQRDQAAMITDASNQAANEMRTKLYGPGGIMERTGTNAVGATEEVGKEVKRLGEELGSRFQTPEEQDAFKKLWGNYEQSMLDTATKHEFQQRAAVRTTSKTAALAGIQDDVIKSYDNPDALATQFDTARKLIRANVDGLPEQAVANLERETVSTLNLQVIQRMAQDDPGKALDYYEAHKGEINGTDHASAQKLVGAISNIRDVRFTVEEAIGSGPAADIMRSLVNAETGGETDPAGAVSPAGAVGVAQLMPGTAREVAKSLGLQHVVEMNDEQLKTYFQTPAGIRNNIRIGTTYLGKQIQKFGGDLEAALIAYNAGPENATKFLNAGRDYNALPKPGETLPYVKKVMSAYRGVEVQGDTSADIQAAANGTTQKYFSGDSRQFLKDRLQAQHGPQAVDGLSQDMSDRLAGMMSDAPDFVKDGLDILSGYRSIERQRELWEKSDKSGKWVARPGGSQHNHGNASDLGWKGGKFSAAPKEVRDWVHANAEKYGLSFPMSYEPWHIETAEARKGGRVKPGQTTRNDPAYAAERVASAWDDQDRSGYVEMKPTVASASDVYTKSIAPFTVGSEPTLAGALSHVREVYADNPVKLAEAERQITDEVNARKAASASQVEDLKKGVLRSIMAGGAVRDVDPKVLEQIGSEGVSQLLTLEGKFKPGGEDKTDDATYIKLAQMDPDEFKGVSLIDFADKLSGADLRQFADKQAKLVRPDVSAAVLATDRTRSQIVGEAQQILGLDPNKKTDDATALSSLNKALDLRIAAHIEETKKQPTGIEIQKMVDDLLIEGKVSRNWASDTSKRVFELTPEERSSFYTAETVEDIAEENRPAVSQVFRRLYSTTSAPGEEAAVSVYNDMVRVDLGGAPTPPPALDAKIKQGLARAYGRAATPEEVANFYREWIKRARLGN